MKTEDQIKALTELDGKPSPHKPTEAEISSGSYYQYEPAYLDSYNAIIPLIRRQSWHIHQKIWLDLCFMLKSQHIFIATPAQLCEALLKATGRWTE